MDRNKHRLRVKSWNIYKAMTSKTGKSSILISDNVDFKPTLIK
jgi:hypothetical protein